MDIVVHNLARAWRPKQFEEIIGQQLIVRILKNSLYKAHYFPAYLFSGQRGCGKTSTARVFAAALNCSELHAFQKQPKHNPVPCLKCASCVAMRAGSHPDFYEIDAASNTGVEHIRALIDSSALCSVMGGKKIYLIDEVHMLSKSAFNAFLKLLEEPPSSVFFILATTDPHKIPDTIQSRCFILQFRPIDQGQTVEHLVRLCEEEDLRYQKDGLALIARSSEGSMRDAVNILERVRFAAVEITDEAVRSILGHTDDQAIVKLLEAVIQGHGEKVLIHLRSITDSGVRAAHVWERLKACIRTLWWVVHGLKPQDFTAFSEQLRVMGRVHNRSRLVQFTELLCLHELAFKRASERYLLLELILLQMCAVDTCKEPAGGKSDVSEVGNTGESQEIVGAESVTERKPVDETLAVLRSIDDPLVQSVMVHALKVSYSQKESLVTLIFPSNRSFFSDLLEQTTTVWMPVLQDSFGSGVRLEWQFTGEAVQEAVSETYVAKGFSTQKGGAVQQGSGESDKSSGMTHVTQNSNRTYIKKGLNVFGGRSSGKAYTLEHAYALRCQTLKKISKQMSQDIPQIAMLLEKFSGTVYQMCEVNR